jgi:hypothetical protein
MNHRKKLYFNFLCISMNHVNIHTNRQGIEAESPKCGGLAGWADLQRSPVARFAP